MFTFSVHCGKNFPLRKQQSDLDISVDDGLEDKEYLSTGGFKGHRWLFYSTCIQRLPGVLELTDVWDIPQWRLTFPGCWTFSVQTWFCTMQASTLIGKMSSGSCVWLTKVSRLLTWTSICNISEFLVHPRAVSERSVRDTDCGGKRCSCCHGYRRGIFQRHWQTGHQTLHRPQSSNTGKTHKEFIELEWLNWNLKKNLYFRFGRSVSSKTFIHKMNSTRRTW